jgi:hypothetical protein
VNEEVEEVYVQQERRNARRGRGQLRWRGAYGEDGYIILQSSLLVFCWLVRNGFKPFAPGAQGKIVEYRSVGPEDPVPIQLFGCCVERCSVRCCVESPMAGIFFWGAKALQHPNRAAPVADDVLGAGLVPLSGAPRVVSSATRIHQNFWYGEDPGYSSPSRSPTYSQQKASHEALCTVTNRKGRRP